MESYAVKKDDGSERWIRVCAGLIAAAVVCFAVVWMFGLVPGLNSPPNSNSLMTISPYMDNGTWVFDDVSAGLVKEPFIAGVPEMIEFVTTDVPNAESGFTMIFSARPFPGQQHKLIWLREESGGNYYLLEGSRMEGWLCPAMFQYFRKAPAQLYVQVKEKR